MSHAVRALVCAALLLRGVVARADDAPNPLAPPALRIYMRSDGEPLTFSARPREGREPPSSCVSPCDASFSPGEYSVRLNGVLANGAMRLAVPGTLYGQYHSERAARAGGWLALNVGAILGGVFVTVGALGGPGWTYIAGGGSLAAGGAIFLIAYRADRASISFNPTAPVDVRGMPEPAPLGISSAGTERFRLGAEPRSVALRVVF